MVTEVAGECQEAASVENHSVSGETLATAGQAQGQVLRAGAPRRVYFNATSDEVAVRAVKDKGVGVVAVKNIPANGRVAFGEPRISKEAAERLVALHFSSNSPLPDLASYLADAGDGKSVHDAHPRHGIKDSIAGLINEPSTGVRANMLLTEETVNGEKRAVYVAVRTIKAGEELTAKYGDNFKRFYKAGQRAKEPSWWSRR